MSEETSPNSALKKILHGFKQAFESQKITTTEFLTIYRLKRKSKQVLSCFIYPFAYLIIFCSDIYNYCINTSLHTSKSKKLKQETALSTHNYSNGGNDGTSVAGGEVYTIIKNYLTGYLEEIYEVRFFYLKKAFPFDQKIHIATLLRNQC